jgi:hypothetical protein
MSRITVTEQVVSCSDLVSKKRVAPNTVEWIDKYENRYIRLHLTDILTFTPNGVIIINSGGWRTSTTKERINHFLPVPWRITQENSTWYLNNHVFADGITINADQTVTGAGNADTVKALKKSITVYIDGFLDKLHNNQLSLPSAGDCWLCTLTDSQSGQPMGERDGVPEEEHILSHIRENYHVPALVLRACQVFGVSQAARSYLLACMNRDYSASHEVYYESYKNVCDRQVKSALRRYIYRAVKLAA